jgi:hypothetical protein
VISGESYPGSFADTFEVPNPSAISGANGKDANRYNPSTSANLEFLGIVNDRGEIFCYWASQFEHTLHAVVRIAGLEFDVVALSRAGEREITTRTRQFSS